MCVVDDLLEHSPAGRVKYAGQVGTIVWNVGYDWKGGTPHTLFTQVLPILLDACGASDADLRQCSVYGIGVLAAKWVPYDLDCPPCLSS